MSAVKTHLIDTAAMGVVGLATVLLLVYGTQFAWEVAHAAYDDHMQLLTEARQKDDYIKTLEGKTCSTCPALSYLFHTSASNTCAYTRYDQQPCN
jgi:hypothetical protein